MIIRRGYILEAGPNPSSDYYLVPALSSCGYSFVKVNINSDSLPEIEVGSTIFIVRYMNKRVLSHLHKNKNRIGNLFYFMDDRLWDLKGLMSLPLAYSFRIFKKAYLYKSALKELGAKLCVSTDYLRHIYTHYNPDVIYPYPLGLENPSISQTKTQVVFYHGTSSHSQEIKWLSQLFFSISNTFPDLVFEIVLSKKNKRFFKNAKNLISLRPMNWGVFYRFSFLKYRKIGLVPLFDNEFNRGRSFTKFYDITRSGAVGIYSEHAPYSKLIKDFNAGIVLPMNKNLWIEAIGTVLGSEELRRELFEGAIKLVEYLKTKALSSYKELLL